MLKIIAATLVTLLAMQGAALAEGHPLAPENVGEAPVSERFGNRTQFFFGGQTGASLGGNTTFGNRTRGTFSIAPLVGYFFTDTVFGRLGAAYSASIVDPVTGNDFISSLVLEPGIGVAIPLGQHSFAPSLSYNFLGAWTLHTGASANGASVDLPFVLRVTPDVGITVGPKLAFRTPGISGGDSVTLAYVLNIGVLIWR